jgi:HEAT repeat protein
MLAELGPDAKDAASALKKANRSDRDEGVQRAIADALKKIGSPPDATDASDKKSQPDSKVAVRDEIQDKIQQEIRRLGSSDYNQFNAASDALVGMGPNAVPALIQALDDDSGGIRMRAAAALRRLGPQAQPAASALARALKRDNREDVRRYAAQALGAVSSELHPELIDAVKDESPRVRLQAIEGLAVFGPAAREAIPALADAMKDRDGNIINAAAITLAKIGKEAVPVLTGYSKDKDQRVREAATAALGRIEDKNPYSLAGKAGNDFVAAVNAIVGGLESDDKWLQSKAVAALRAAPNAGVMARQAVPALIRLLQDDDPNVRDGAAEALGNIGPWAKAALEPLQAQAGKGPKPISGDIVREALRKIQNK